MSANTQRTVDLEHLRILAILYYVMGAMLALFSCFPLIYVVMGIAMMTGAMDDRGRGPPPEVGIIIFGIGMVITLFIWTWAGLNLTAGRALSQHTRYRLVFVIACIDCLNAPLGMLLGIFTIIVLSRPGVKEIFEGEPQRDRRAEFFDDRDDFDDRDLPAPGKPADEGRYTEQPPKGGPL